MLADTDKAPAHVAALSLVRYGIAVALNAQCSERALGIVIEGAPWRETGPEILLFGRHAAACAAAEGVPFPVGHRQQRLPIPPRAAAAA